MRNLSAVLFILSFYATALADLAPLNEGKETEQSGTCLGFTLLLTGFIILAGFVLKKWKAAQS